LKDISIKTRQRDATNRLKNILIESDDLNKGELVVHKNYGIGRFVALETLELLGKPHDCLKILYANDDKLYIPVENIETIKKYGQFEAELDKLGSSAWQKRTSKIKNHINDIAQQLLRLTAERKLALTDTVQFDHVSYDKFCSMFNYIETNDQIIAINDIKNDLSSGALMDRLICGDVGFGKTEVAMRCVHLIATSINDNKPQIAIVVPTTILCKQHYSRFLERFDGFGLNIMQLSRLISNKEANIVKAKLKNGQVDIIIGTHALLTKNIEFNNLKLLIIDEEQRFGTIQKEYLKKLKTNIHVLSLSATPIPRTLQMSMVGLKDLSLIASPPLDRLESKIVVMQFDDIIIREALLKEHRRGGKSFYICPKIKDIAEIEAKLKQIIPELKYKIIHGQINPSIVDKIMNEFCDGYVDILLSTNIIESGIDISNANTIIIHRADEFGLSQLYQLKGRIGRGKVQGYAYLTLVNNKNSTKHALKRLQIIQESASLGSGFMIANHDMDLRGFGNLIGQEQSGHVREVGVELYQDMLSQAIMDLNQNIQSNDTEILVPKINLNLPIFIPDHYIQDASLKLGIYRRIGNLLDQKDIEDFQEEMRDRFGTMPIEFENLLKIVQIKLICIKLCIEQLDSSDEGFILKFYKHLNVTDIVMKCVTKYPLHVKVRPDNKLVFIKKINQANITYEAMSFLMDILEN
jgi:transcription-repair coupling factor (superfamily II helicase)